MEKRYQLQKLSVRSRKNCYEEWKPVITSNYLNALDDCLAEDHRIFDTETGNEIVRFEFGMKKYNQAALKHSS